MQRAHPPGHDEQIPRARIAARWFSVLGPPTAAFAQQQFAYSFVDLACTKHAPVLVHLPLVLALGITAWAARLAWQEWPRDSNEFHAHDDASTGSRLFFSAVALVMIAISSAVILAQWLPTVFLHPCQR